MKLVKPVLLLMILILWTAPTFSADSVRSKPFAHKLIFSETPDMGSKWNFGLRSTDILTGELSLNVNNWVHLDYLLSGIPNLKFDPQNSLSDFFSVFTVKSPSFDRSFSRGDYRLAGGLKLYSSSFYLIGKTEGKADSAGEKDNSTVLFLTQDFRFKEKHTVNLFSSLSFRSHDKADGSQTTTTTWYLVPGYRFALNDRWTVSLEYYMTNTEKLPIKLLQFLFDEDKLDFFNTERELYSFMFYGFQYSRKHLRIDLNLGHHISFTPPFVPLLGVGWNF